MENREADYYRHRDRFNALLDAGAHETREAASLFYYLNRTGYNGLCRFNRQGRFNVPFGRYARIRYIRNFEPYRDLLADWAFACGDLESVRFKADDFVYADPPYDVEFTAYSAGGFTWDDQARTAAQLSKHPGPVVLVNQATPRVERLYRKVGFSVSFLTAPRRISCTGNRAPAREILATRNL